jgi:Silicon transporter
MASTVMVAKSRKSRLAVFFSQFGFIIHRQHQNANLKYKNKTKTMSHPTPEATSIFDPLNVVKSIASSALFGFSLSLIMGLIFTEQTKVSAKVHPAVAFITIWLVAIWLTMIEGGQASIVGLAPVNRELYRKSHPWAYKCSLICHKGDNLERYLLGRQFMVVLVVFIINNCGAALADAELWGLPHWISTSFLHSGLAMIFFTVMFGQLSSEVNASLCMLDYLNNWFGLFTVYVALALEFSGILHAGYLIQMIVCKLAGKEIESREPPKEGFTLFFFWIRVLFSCTALGIAFAVTLTALFQGKTTMWDSVPPGAAVFLFFGLMSLVGLLEATQISYFAVSKLRVAERGSNWFAKNTCDVLYAGKDGQPGVNLPGYMIGRQLCVVSCMFFVATVTSTKIEPGESNIFGMTNGMQKFCDTGLLGALITTIVGSIAWRLAGSAFPIFFLSTPPAWVMLKVCLGFEASGMLNGAWVLGWIHKKVAGFQTDEVYIGTAEERASQNKPDNEDELQIGAGHMIILPGFYETAPESLKALLRADPRVAEYIRSLHAMEKGEVDYTPDNSDDNKDLKKVISEDYA